MIDIHKNAAILIIYQVPPVSIQKQDEEGPQAINPYSSGLILPLIPHPSLLLPPAGHYSVLIDRDFPLILLNLRNFCLKIKYLWYHGLRKP